MMTQERLVVSATTNPRKRFYPNIMPLVAFFVHGIGYRFVPASPPPAQKLTDQPPG